jgi:hypothetical protein
MRSMYPILPSSEEPDQRFRLARIAELDSFLASEIEGRRSLCKKYTRAFNIVQGATVGAATVGVCTEVAGLALLSTGVGAPLGIPLAGVGIGAFLIDLACIPILRKINRKRKKHDEIMQTAKTKLSTIHQIVSQAMTDGKISDEEFKLVSTEIEKYDTLKAQIRSEAHRLAETNETEKKALIEQGREEVRAQFARTLGVPSLPK